MFSKDIKINCHFELVEKPCSPQLVEIKANSRSLGYARDDSN